MAEETPTTPPPAGNQPEPPAPPQPGQGNDNGDQPGPVPYDRFKAVNEKARTLEQQLAKIEADRKAAEEKAAAERGEWEKIAKRREADLAAERLNNARLRVAAQKGIPADLVGRLQGDTEEAIAQDADKLLAFLKPASGPGTPPAPRGSQPPTVDLANMTPKQIREAYQPPTD